MEFVNAKQVDIRLDLAAERSEGSWSRQKVRATVLHDWDLSNFPFDRQALQVDLRIADSGALAYRPDEAESGYGEDVAPDGWRVTDFEIEEHAKAQGPARAQCTRRLLRGLPHDPDRRGSRRRLRQCSGDSNSAADSRMGRLA